LDDNNGWKTCFCFDCILFVDDVDEDVICDDLVIFEVCNDVDDEDFDVDVDADADVDSAFAKFAANASFDVCIALFALFALLPLLEAVFLVGLDGGVSSRIIISLFFGACAGAVDSVAALEDCELNKDPILFLL
jgi:hypothetical protein